MSQMGHDIFANLSRIMAEPHPVVDVFNGQTFDPNGWKVDGKRVSKHRFFLLRDIAKIEERDAAA